MRSWYDQQCLHETTAPHSKHVLGSRSKYEQDRLRVVAKISLLYTHSWCSNDRQLHGLASHSAMLHVLLFLAIHVLLAHAWSNMLIALLAFIDPSWEVLITRSASLHRLRHKIHSRSKYGAGIFLSYLLPPGAVGGRYGSGCFHFSKRSFVCSIMI